MKPWMARFGLLFYLIRRDVTAMQVQYLKRVGTCTSFDFCIEALNLVINALGFS